MKKRNKVIMIILLILCAFSSLFYLEYKRKSKVFIKKEISMLVSLDGDNGKKELMESAIEEFNKGSEEYYIKPSFALSDSHAILKLIYSKSVNMQYHIVSMGAEQLHTLRNLDLVKELDEYLLEDFDIRFLNSIDPIFMAHTSDNGNIYSVPYIRNSQVIFYDKSRIQLEDNISFEELMELSEKNPVLFPSGQVFTDLVVYEEPYSTDENSSKYRSVTVNLPYKVEMINKIKERHANGSFVFYRENGVLSLEPFLKREIPIIAANSYYMDKINTRASFPIGTAVLKINEDKSFPLQGSNLYMLRQNSKEEYDSIWRVITELLKISIKNGEQQGGIPLIKNSDSKNHIAEYPYNSFSSMAVSQNSKVELLVETVINNIMQNGEDAEESIKELQDKINSVIEGEWE